MDGSQLWNLLNNGRLYGERRCMEAGLDSNTTDVRICLYLQSHPDVSQYDIASFHSMSESTIAKAMRRLEKEGFVVRKVNPDDRRAKVVSLSPEGKRFCAHVQEIQGTWARRVAEYLTEDESREFDRLCGKICAGSERVLERRESPDRQIVVPSFDELDPADAV